MEPRRYYGHFFWPPGKNDYTFSCNETLVNTVTSLLRPNVFGLLVTVLTGLHCTGKQTVYVSCESIVTEVAFERSRK